MTIGTRLFTWKKGELVGTDAQGNVYYRERSAVPGRRQRRWVLYNGEAEATRVPAGWHAWLHYTTDEVPADGSGDGHQPNLSGTEKAYRPGGHLLTGEGRPPASGDYEPWQPE